MKHLIRNVFFGIIISCIAAFALADDANYLMAIFNDTNSDITVSIDPWRGGGEHSSCIDLAIGTEFSKAIKIAPGRTAFLGFWRSGQCHGKQGWLAIRASGEDLPMKFDTDDDFQQFWFDAAGSFSKYGNNSSYANYLVANTTRVIGSTVALDFHIGRSR
jgi:hypothetical protein